MEWKLSCGEIVLIDEEDYNKIDKNGWYLSDKYHGEDHRKTRYVVHDIYGRLHRYILGIKKNEKKNIIIDHIDRNGLNCQRNNLRVVDTSSNKKNQSTTKVNQFNFNGISLEYNRQKDYLRLKVSFNKEKLKHSTKSFSFGKFETIQDCLKAAVLFRIEQMKLYGYTLDERSTTIETELKNNHNIDIEALLDINLKEIIRSRVDSSESKWT